MDETTKMDDTAKMLKFLSRTYRRTHDERRKFEIRFFIGYLTLVLVLLVAMSSERFDIPAESRGQAVGCLVLLMVVTSVYLWHLHKKNHCDMDIAYAAELELFHHLKNTPPDLPEKARKLAEVLPGIYHMRWTSFYCQVAAMILLTVIAALFIYSPAPPVEKGNEVAVKHVLRE